VLTTDNSFPKLCITFALGTVDKFFTNVHKETNTKFLLGFVDENVV
jgi:hypothetical protein